MHRTLLPFLVALVLVACSKHEEPPAPTAMPEVNDANCKPDAIRAIPDEPMQTKFAGMCLRRGRLQKGSDQGLKM